MQTLLYTGERKHKQQQHLYLQQRCKQERVRGFVFWRHLPSQWEKTSPSSSKYCWNHVFFPLFFFPIFAKSSFIVWTLPAWLVWPPRPIFGLASLRICGQPFRSLTPAHRPIARGNSISCASIPCLVCSRGRQDGQEKKLRWNSTGPTTATKGISLWDCQAELLLQPTSFQCRQVLGAVSPALVSPCHHTQYFATKAMVFAACFFFRLVMHYLLSLFHGTWKVLPHNTFTSFFLWPGQPHGTSRRCLALPSLWNRGGEQLDIVNFLVYRQRNELHYVEKCQKCFMKGFSGHFKKCRGDFHFLTLLFLFRNFFHNTGSLTAQWVSVVSL